MDKPNFNRIKAALAENKKLAKDLADALNVHEQTVSSWSTNNKQPSIETLFKIALYLGKDAGDLLTKSKDLHQ